MSDVMGNTAAGRAAAPRCAWAVSDRAMRYHDEEWGVPLHDDRALFEFLVLEGAQAGLSWETILRKREAYRAAFDNFAIETVAAYDQRKVEALLADAGIVRNRRKIEAAIQNARVALAIRKEFGSLDAYLWRFVGGSPRRNAWQALEKLPGADGGVGRDEQGSAAARLLIRGIDDLLCVYAGDGHGERSCGGLLSLRGDSGDDALTRRGHEWPAHGVERG